MKLKHIITCSLVACLTSPVVLAQQKSKTTTSSKISPSANKSIVKKASVEKKSNQTVVNPFKLQNSSDSLSYALGIDVAKSMKSAGFDINAEAFQLGFKQHLTGDSVLFSENQKDEIIQAGVKVMVDKRNAELSKEGKEFLKQNASAPHVKVLENGLQYEVLREGTGEQPTSNDEVVVHYEGTLINGTKFDSSYDRDAPLTLSLHSVIEGWKIGIPMMKVGSKYKFYVPHELGYGGRASGPIPAFSTLIFTVELLEIKK